jgi:YD repeat-containing protein
MQSSLRAGHCAGGPIQGCRALWRRGGSGLTALALLVVLFVGAFASPAGWAQTRTTVVEAVKPILLYALRVPPAGTYDSPEEAFSAYMTLYVNVELVPRYGTVVQNFHACVPPQQYGYSWGAPYYWCWDIDSYANDNFGFSTLSGITLTEKCPDGYTWANTQPLSGSGTGGVPYVFERRCEKNVPARDPRCCQVGNPMIVESGSKRQVETDYVDPRGVLTFTRVYDSVRGGFAHNFAADFLPPEKGATASCSLLKTSYTVNNAGVVRKFCYPRLRADSTAASYITPSGDRYEFSWNGATGTPSLPYSKDRLVASPSGGWILSMLGEHRLYVLDAAGRLDSVVTVDGQRVRLSYSSTAIAGVAPGPGYLTTLTDSFGRSLQLRYNAGGQLTELVDPNGQTIRYEHEALAHPPLDGKSSPWAQSAKPGQVTYQDNNAITYLWDEPAHATGTAASVHLLTGIVDANGDRFAIYRYTNGKATSTEHAGGVEKYAVTDTRSASTGMGPVTVTDPLGTTRTWQFALAAGIPRITSISQPSGAGSTASSATYTYDANGNVASRTDFSGNKTCRTNDLARNLETTQVEGLASAAGCAAVLADGAALPAGARKTSTQWHPLWNLPVGRAEPGKITTTVYNGQTDATGSLVKCAPDTAVLPDGSPIAVVCARVEQATTDSTGAVGFSATVAGTPRTWTYTYNEHGQVLAARDPLNNLATYAYYSDTTAEYTRGDLESVINPAGHATQYTRYDRSGRLLERVDANGTKTETTYTPRGWVKTVTTTPPGAAAQVTVYDYDGVGQLKKATLSDGTALEYTYDAAHRLRGIKDAAGNAVIYALDNTGNRTGEELKDASGTLARNITRVYDALNRVQTMTGAPQ